MSGNFEDALLAIDTTESKRKALQSEGLGTDDSTLIRVMVSRCEVDMLEIRSEFKKMYGKSLHSFIKVAKTCSFPGRLFWRLQEGAFEALRRRRLSLLPTHVSRKILYVCISPTNSKLYALYTRSDFQTENV
ncbi:hypothetical protein AB205_0012630 [Aquarana catesbeiana]|uniref:Annexin n=1 Tax=Aquarana catesbeiana TaxID=8400 RepID=A0A2G9P288_AQUCT|nr:hypothetical protein AB205_0012630 [Aquarana catesbeiana]